MIKPLILDSCFKIIEDQINPQTSIIKGVGFHLNQKTLGQILIAKEEQKPLLISESILNQLRYYCLIDQHQLFNLQSELNFFTYYDQISPQKPLLKTTFSLGGKIQNQICDRCLNDQDFLLNISGAHYWLISEILGKIKLEFKPLKVRKWFNLIAWIVAVIIVLISVIFNLVHFQNNVWLWIAPIMVCFLLQWGINKILWLNIHILRRWLLKQMLYGIFSRQNQQQKQSLNILSNLGLQ